MVVRNRSRALGAKSIKDAIDIMDKRRAQLRWPVVVFLVLAALEGMLVACPSVGLHFPYWAQASAIGLCVLTGIAWFAVPKSPVA
jgi:hypothetical protein